MFPPMTRNTRGRSFRVAKTDEMNTKGPSPCVEKGEAKMKCHFYEKLCLLIMGLFFMTFCACSHSTLVHEHHIQETQTYHAPSEQASCTVIVEETERYHIMELKVTESQTSSTSLDQTKYLFSTVSRDGNKITLSCDACSNIGSEETTLFISFLDTKLQTYATYTYHNVLLHKNARITLSHAGPAEIIVTDDTGEITYKGFISEIS